jgi:2-polyprenyl-3-methyl-5-hydroxy-6-metoxy-1,4-benzoquinol methylase
MDIQSVSSGLELGEDGIWYSRNEQEISYPSGGNEACFALEDNSFWFRHRNNCIASVVTSFPPKDGGTIFDIGGGNGFVALGLARAGFDVALLEPGREGASNAKNRGLKNVICATTETAGLKQQSLSAIGLFDVIEHIENDQTFLQSMCHFMKNGGRLYATVPSYPLLWSEEDVDAGHFRRYTLKTICRVLESAGFQIEFSTYIFRFLPVPIFLLRSLPYRLGLSRKQKDAKSASRDHASGGGTTSRLLESMLQKEIRKLDKGKSMRFGGSCLLVAKRP